MRQVKVYNRLNEWQYKNVARNKLLDVWRAADEKNTRYNFPQPTEEALKAEMTTIEKDTFLYEGTFHGWCTEGEGFGASALIEDKDGWINVVEATNIRFLKDAAV